MAGLNASIILSGRAPDYAETYSANYDRGRQRGLEDNKATADRAFAADVAAYDPGQHGSLPDYLKGKGHLDQAYDYSKKEADIAKTQSETGKVGVESHIKDLELAGQINQGLLSMPRLSKQAIMQQAQNYVQQGILKPEHLQATQQELANVPDDDAALRQVIESHVQSGMKALDFMKYQRPDANAQLSAQTSLANNQLDAQMQGRGQDMNYSLGQGNLSLNRDKERFNQGMDLSRYNLDQKKYGLDEYKLKNPKAAGGAISEDERKAAGWLAQANNAYKNMLDVLDKSPDADSPSALEALLPEGAKGAVQSPGRQRYTQAASSFSEAALRAATGAGVNRDEAAQKIRELTPGYFDTPELKRQKADSLKVYLESLNARANRAAPEGYQVPTPGGGGQALPKPDGASDEEWAAFLKSKGM